MLGQKNTFKNEPNDEEEVKDSPSSDFEQDFREEKNGLREMH